MVARSRPRFVQLATLLAESRLVTLLISLLFTLGMLFNYLVPLNALLYTMGIKGQDCGQMIWNIWSTNEAITSGHNPFSTNQVFYPLGTSLAHHTLAAGFFPLTFLVKKLSGNDPLYPFYTYKIIILLSIALILWLSYLTLRELELTRWAALIAAVGYAFSDFYTEHILHINHLAGFFIPLTAVFLIRAYKKPASANFGLAALAAACSVYFTEFSIYICLAAFFFLVAVALFRTGRSVLATKVGELGWRRLLTAAIIFVAIVAPFAINLFKDKIRKPAPSESSHYSANLAGFLIPGVEREEPELYGAPLTTPLYGRAFVSLDSTITLGTGGFEIFVGFPLLVFSVIALAKIRTQILRVCTAVGLMFFLLSLGPTLKIFSAETGVPLPYAVLMRIPPFDAGRSPVRFVVVGSFFLMIVAACGISWMEKFLAARLGVRGHGWSWLAMLLVFAWMTAEAYSPTPRRLPFVAPAALSRIAPGPVLNLPPLPWDGYAAMLQTFHRQPIATGYLARYTDAQREQFSSLKAAFEKGGASFCEYVKSNGLRTVIISPDEVTRPYQASMSPLELSRCPVTVIDLRERGPGLFGVPQPDGGELRVDYPPYVRGTRIDFGTVEVDKYLWYGWSGGETRWHWTDRGRATLVFSLAPPNELSQRTVTLQIFGGPFLAPGRLNVQRVVLRLNDQEIANWKLTSPEPQVRSIEIPASMLRDKNVLLFELPDASSPSSLGISEDGRLLGFSVQWIEID